ncbi:uncharacterized [Tachysurus ichikawai]
MSGRGATRRLSQSVPLFLDTGDLYLENQYHHSNHFHHCCSYNIATELSTDAEFAYMEMERAEVTTKSNPASSTSANSFICLLGLAIMSPRGSFVNFSPSSKANFPTTSPLSKDGGRKPNLDSSEEKDLIEKLRSACGGIVKSRDDCSCMPKVSGQ